ncbi:CBS domain-containing protein [Candidatus Woesearchaeota archaeon]|nr:CBS domain-containing protein [Candidatus Woesearchaeota archaeon]MBW3017502.1 CBS domain-containing protein [Candidatus Woesearchaeota archaeon]
MRKAAIKKMRERESKIISAVYNIKKLTAKNAMIKPVFVYPDDDADKIIKKLKREDTNVCIVVTKEKQFVGEISDEDLIRVFMHQARHEPLAKFLNIGYKRKLSFKNAKDLVNKHKSTVKTSTPINRVIELVYKEGFQYIPVLDKNRKVVGVVTPSSILDLLENN